MKTTIQQFRPSASLPQQAIVVLFDLEGFSKFFSQPDVQDYVAKYLNEILSVINICYEGGTAYWSLDKKGNPYVKPPLHKPLHSKFLGDGALYVFRYNDFTDDNRVTLINRLWDLKNNFQIIVEKLRDDIPIIDIPQNIRIGITAGTVYKLTYSNSNKEEYIGYSINLASRLQSYCRQVGLTVSGRMNIKSNRLEKSNYIKVIAKNIKGFPQEIVIVDKADYNSMDLDTRNALFDLA